MGGQRMERRAVKVDASTTTGLGRPDDGPAIDDGDGTNDVELAGGRVEVAPPQAAELATARSRDGGQHQERGRAGSVFRAAAMSAATS